MRRKQACQRCGLDLRYRRVTCCACGRAIGQWYDCGCGEKWTESGPARYFCNKDRGSDCAKTKVFMISKFHAGELTDTFVKKMVRLNGRWP